MFQRDESRRFVIDAITPGCEWVADGEGYVTRKWDGTCCMIRDGVLYKRREVKPGKLIPPLFETTEHDPATGKTFGWVPVGDGPEDDFHREAFYLKDNWQDGTYELIGPRINGNRDHWDRRVLVPHGESRPYIEPARTYEALRDWLTGPNRLDWEGFVFYHPDGRMAKIKAKDFPRRG